MQGISSKAVSFGEPGNKMKYNGIEKEEALELNIYDAQFRELDPQAARWWQIDPVTEGYENISPYASMYNNPITISDPLGDEGEGCCDGTILGDILEGGHNLLISAAGMLDGAINTLSMGYISSDPFNYRNKLNEDQKGWFDGGVRVGQIVPLFTPGGKGRVSETPELASANGVKIRTNQPVKVQETPATNNVQAKSNSSSGLNNKPRNAPQSKGTPNSSKIEAKDANGKTTKYSTYDANGNLVKQVQVDKGSTRHGTSGATVKEPNLNTNPNTGKTFQNGFKIRKATPDETPPGQNQ